MAKKKSTKNSARKLTAKTLKKAIGGGRPDMQQHWHPLGHSKAAPKATPTPKPITIKKK